ncbi:tetratricopeptide repeat protein [Streptomyces phaeochromogenes]
MLADPTRPVVLVGTIWPEHFERLSAPGASEGDQDLNQDSKQILEFARRFPLASRFSTAEQSRARFIADADPRISEALKHAGSENLPEVLAAAPELINRWEQAADCYGAALISAAVDARRCGHPEPIPTHLLERLATTYLTGTQKAKAPAAWFSAGLDWASQPVRGTAAPLSPEATEIGRLDGYRVSDILVQHAQHTNTSATAVPEARWLLIIEEASPQVCLVIGAVALSTRIILPAEQACRKAVEAGQADAMVGLGLALHEQGESAEASTWFQRAAESGNAFAMIMLGFLLEHQGDDDQALSWYQQGAEVGVSEAKYSLGRLLYRLGNTSQARSWLLQAADAGLAHAMNELAVLFQDQGDTDQAITWFRRATEAGHVLAMTNLGSLFRARDEIEKAIIWYQQAAELGNAYAMCYLGAELHSMGEVQQARNWWQRAAETGNTVAMTALDLHHEYVGDAEQAIVWYQRAAEAGETNAMNILAKLLEHQGAAEEARSWYQQAAEAGNLEAANRLAELPST